MLHHRDVDVKALKSSKWVLKLLIELAHKAVNRCFSYLLLNIFMYQNIKTQNENAFKDNLFRFSFFIASCNFFENVQR